MTEDTLKKANLIKEEIDKLDKWLYPFVCEKRKQKSENGQIELEIPARFQLYIKYDPLDKGYTTQVISLSNNKELNEFYETILNEAADKIIMKSKIIIENLKLELLNL